MSQQSKGPPRKRMAMGLTAEDFTALGADMMNRSTEGSELTMDARFRSLFGVSAVVCAIIWQLLCTEAELPTDCTAVYLLWALMFLKTYDTEKNLANTAGGVDEKTYRKWVWIVLDGIAYLEFTVIRWENRKRIDLGNDCLVSVDGVDFEILAFSSLPFKKQKAWFTKKHNGPGIRYEVGLSILGGDIVWVHGGFPCGDWPDLEIFRHALIHWLDPNERVETDKGYRGAEHPAYIKRPGLLPEDHPVEVMRGSVRGRHEHVNERFKNFKVLKLPFRHEIGKHATCFTAVAVLTQLMIENGDPLTGVNYDDTVVPASNAAAIGPAAIGPRQADDIDPDL